MNAAIIIFGMFLVTFGVRYGSLVITQQIALSPAFMRALRYVPVAVLTALTIPFLVYRENGLDLSLAESILGGGHPHHRMQRPHQELDPDHHRRHGGVLCLADGVGQLRENLPAWGRMA
ncbi:MAG UNVERIFIED_CONTAM: AzlD domain-containing protein [Anaerolineae bacterium]|jgi:uncharacterized membrane protein